MKRPVDLSNCVIIHVMENGEFDIISSAMARIIVVNDKDNEEYEYRVHDKPSLLRDFMGDSVNNLTVVHAEEEYHEDAPISPSHLRVVSDA